MTIKEYCRKHGISVSTYRNWLRLGKLPEPRTGGNRAISKYRNEEGWIEFQQQRNNAKKRCIEWKLTYPQWWDIWRRSGHWHERGRKAGQYVMARIRDKGPYAVGNVRIILRESNEAEKVPGRHTEEYKRAMSERSKGNQHGLGNRSRTGQTNSSKTRAKLSIAGKAAWADPIKRASRIEARWRTRLAKEQGD